MVDVGCHEPDQNVALVRFVWKKKGSEEDRLKELKKTKSRYLNRHLIRGDDGDILS